jgi:HEAT repeat protein
VKTSTKHEASAKDAAPETEASPATDAALQPKDPIREVTAREVNVPTKVLDIFAALANDVERRPHLLEALKRADERELSEAFRTRKVGVQADQNVGAALAAAGLGNSRWLAPVRKLSSDPDPRVRAAVATALGALCTPAVLNSLEELVQDADPKVHVAALDALVAGARRIGAVPAARRLLQELRPTEDEAIKAARAGAIAALAP